MLLISAIATLIKEWQSKGCPMDAPVPSGLGGFEGWKDVAANILHCVGIEGFLENLSRIQEEAADNSEILFINWWWDNFNTEPVACNEDGLGKVEVIGDSEKPGLGIDIRGDSLATKRRSMGAYVKRLMGKTFVVSAGRVKISSASKKGTTNRYMLNVIKPKADDGIE